MSEAQPSPVQIWNRVKSALVKEPKNSGALKRTGLLSGSNHAFMLPGIHAAWARTGRRKNLQPKWRRLK